MSVRPSFSLSREAKKETLGVAEQRILIIGETRGTADNRVLIENIQDDEMDERIGITSTTYYAIKRFKKFNPYSKVDVLCLKPTAGGVKAEGAISVIGTATKSKDIYIRIGDDEFMVKVSIFKGDLHTHIVTKIKNAFAGRNFPFTIEDGDNAGEVKVVYGVEGIVGNDLEVVIDGEIPGVEITGTKTSGGNGNYDGTSALLTIPNRVNFVVFDQCIEFQAIENWLVIRDDNTRKMMRGHGFTMLNNSVSGFSATVNALPPSWKGHVISIFANCTEEKYNAQPLLLCAEVSSKLSLRLSEGRDIKGIVVNPSASPGGIHTSTLPVHNTPMSYYPPKNRLAESQSDTLYEDGFSLLATDGDNVVLGDVMTMWQGEAIFKTYEGVTASSIVQEVYFNNLKREVSQKKLVTGKAQPNSQMIDKEGVKTMLYVNYKNLVDLGIIENDVESEKRFLNSISVNIDVDDRSISVDYKVELVSQVSNFVGNIYFSYSEAK